MINNTYYETISITSVGVFIKILGKTSITAIYILNSSYTALPCSSKSYLRNFCKNKIWMFYVFF